MNPSESFFPDSKIKQIKKLQAILNTWRNLEEQLCILQVSVENILEQQKVASSGLSSSFSRLLETQSKLSQNTIDSIPGNLMSKILQSKKELEAKISATKQEFDPLQRQLYQLKNDISKSLSGILCPLSLFNQLIDYRCHH